MGSQIKRHKLNWIGDPQAHAFIVKDGVPSAVSLCNLPFREVSGESTAQCPRCHEYIEKRVRVTWQNPRKA